MSLKIKHIKNIIEQYAPLDLKESYDNVGLMVGDVESEVTSVLVALDCTLEVIEEAKEKQCNLILTHHPLLFRKPSSITTETLLGRKIIELIKNDINVYSSHTNLDSVSEGLNDILMELLGLRTVEVLQTAYSYKHSDKAAGIGRLAILDEPITLESFCDKVKLALGIDTLRYTGDNNMLINKIAVINGSGQDYFEIAKNKGANCILTGDTSYHYVSDCCEENIAIIDAGHFGTEWPAMKVFANVVKRKINSLGFCNDVFISEKTRDPYKNR